MARRLWLTVLGVVIVVATASVARAQSDLRAWHADGQTWLVWTNDRAFAGLQTYDIYRSSQPITSLAGATRVGRLYPEDWEAPRLTVVDPDATWSIPDGAGGRYQLAADEALFVYTPHAASPEYFAVVKSGNTLLTNENRVGPVAQTIGPTQCHEQLRGVTDLGFAYTIWAHWVDGRDDHASGRADYPVMANAGFNGTGHVFAVYEPEGGRPPGVLPAVVQLHGGRGTYTNWEPKGGRTEGKLDNSVPGGFVIALDDVLYVAKDFFGLATPSVQNTWWFGYWQGYDRFAVPAAPPPDGGLVVDYTLRRVRFILDWLLANYPIDSDRVGVLGHSMGGAGTSYFARLMPERFSAATAFCAPYAGPVRDPFIDFLVGSRAQDLPTTLPGDMGFITASRHATTLPGTVDLPPIRYVFGRNDESVPWYEDDTTNFPAMMREADATRRGQSFDWDERTHMIPEWIGTWVGTPRHDARTLVRITRTDSFPAFSAVDHDEALGRQPDPGNGPLGSGESWGTWGGWLAWDEASVTDTPGEWGATLSVVGSSPFAADVPAGDQATTDVTIRRAQAFLPAPGAALFHTLRDVETGTIVRSGPFVADASGVATVGGVTLFKEPRRTRLTITPALDVDADGVDAQLDCDDANGAAWARPGEVRDVSVSGATLSWNTPEEPGSSLEALRYDVLRSPAPDDFAGPGAACLATAIAPASFDDAAAPQAGALFAYLVRARSGCANGVGSAGRASDGTERVARACP